MKVNIKCKEIDIFVYWKCFCEFVVIMFSFCFLKFSLKREKNPPILALYFNCTKFIEK